MPKILPLLLAAIAALGAEDPWAKVQQIKSGFEVRVFKRGAAQPVLARFDEAREDALSVIIKNAQVSVPRDEIDRIDARPPKVVKRITGGLSVTSEEFKTVYRRPPAKKEP